MLFSIHFISLVFSSVWWDILAPIHRCYHEWHSNGSNSIIVLRCTTSRNCVVQWFHIQYAYNNFICTKRALLFSQSTITAIVRFNSAINITEHIFHMLYFSALRLLFHDWPSLYSHENIFQTKKMATQAHITYVMDFVFESIWIINQISVHTYNSPNIIFSLFSLLISHTLLHLLWPQNQ